MSVEKAAGTIIEKNWEAVPPDQVHQVQDLPVQTLTFSTGLRYHARTIWLFTKSDLVTSTITDTCFAMTGLIASDAMLVDFRIDNRLQLIPAAVASLCFTWYLTLCFNLGNQRQPAFIAEDALNKPWRPIPAGRITPREALIWQICAIVSLVTFCYTVLGAWHEVICYILCTFLYNEFGWADKSWWQRTLLNCLGLKLNHAAALRIAVGATQGFSQTVEFTDKTIVWLVMCGLVIASTLQVQDLRDQEGDAEIDRRTIPLLYGDPFTRWSTAVGVFSWSLVCPFYWELSVVGYGVVLVVATCVSAHVLCYQDRRSDHLSFRYVAIWWVVLFFLPVMDKYHL